MKRPLLIAITLACAAGSSLPAQNPFALKDVQPATMDSIRAKEAGVVFTVEVSIGDEVNPGQILARLDHERQLHTYNTAKVRAENRSGIDIAEGDLMEKSANLTEMQNRYRRRQVSEAQVTQAQGQQKSSQGKYDQAKMFAELAKLEFELAERMLEKRFLRASIKGTVVEIAKARGEKAAEGDVIVTVADLTELSAGIPMSSESAAALSPNASLPVRLAGSNITRIARVQSITALPKGAKGEQMVRIVFDNPNPARPLASQVCEVLLPEGVKALTIAKEPAPAPKSEPAKKPPATKS
ncbi:MAG TPA: HlyD family efflux transporter periplasmic adaptor subunit [Terrimicrobiaceae bacterium]|nr:HlyD family efflux transporter periplasmic adaptor subunit [Terrimicrobiaceae bacterium]